jgi:AcrR family transcriptional regulator
MHRDCTSGKEQRRVPRGEKRRDEIAAVAERVFLERGFAETTMQTIATRAGASKETLYRHFGSKECLFSEIMRSRAMRFTGSSAGDFHIESHPEKALFDFGLTFLKFLFKDDALALYRLVVAETPRAPELGRIFYEQGPKRVLHRLARYLEAETARGRLACGNPDLAAKLFLGAVIASHHLIELVNRPKERPTVQALSEHTREAVSMFLVKYGVKPAP